MRPTNGTHTPAADTAAVVTIAAVSNRIPVIFGYDWSYSANVAAATTLTVVDGATTVHTEQIPALANLNSRLAGGRELISGLHGTSGQALVVTLGAGGGSTVGSLNVRYGYGVAR